MPSSSGQPTPWHIGDVIDGKYEVVAVLGTGGMGTVHRVRHLEWAVDLAVKSPKPEWFSAREDIDRFIAEARTWVRLGLHPNVCGCHYVRELDGIPRLFAEYMSGGSLRERIDDGSLYTGDPARVTARLLRIASQMARGLEHAHSQGVLHLDVKPANVLLDSIDPGVTAKITDFGLAYARAVATGHPGVGTGTLRAPGIRLMTGAYASPEQADAKPVDQRSDIYSFAASVLDMFVGGVSWGPGAAGAFLAQLEHDDEFPREAPPPEELVSLLSRCLRDNPDARPTSMATVTRELADLYSAAAPGASPLPAVAESVELRAAEHNNYAVSLMDLGNSAEAESELRAALTADPQHLDAVYNAGLMRWRQGVSSDEDLLLDLQNAALHAKDARHHQVLLAYVHTERGDIRSARRILEAVARERDEDPAALQAASALESLGITGTENGHVTSLPWGSRREELLPFDRVQFSRDGTRAVSGKYGGGCLLWDTDSGECLHRCAPEGETAMKRQIVDVTADCRFGAEASDCEHPRIWDFTTGRSLRLFPPDGRSLMLALRVAPDGSLAYGVARTGELLSWNLRRGLSVPRGVVVAHSRLGTAGWWARLEVSADGSSVLVTVRGSAGGYRLLQLDASATRERVLGESLPRMSAMALTPDGGAAVTAHDDHRIRVWDGSRGECQREIITSSGISALAVTADARWALTGGEDGAVRMWDLAAGRCLRTFAEHQQPVCAVWLSPDGRLGRSASNDNTARSWELRFPTRYQAPPQLSQPYRTAQVSSAGSQARLLIGQARDALSSSRYAAAADLLDRARTVPGFERSPARLAVWRELSRVRPRTGLRGAWPVRVLRGQRSPLTGFFVSLSADARFAAGGHANHALLWNTDDGTALRELPAGTFAASLTADGKQVLCATVRDTVQLCSVESGDLIRTLELPGDAVLSAVSAMADGGQVLLGYQDGRLQLWDTRTGRRLRALSGHDKMIRFTQIAPDGGTAVSAADDAVRVWDLRDSKCVLTIPVRGRRSVPDSVCMSFATGNFVVTDAYRKSMRLWNTYGETVCAFEGQPEMVITAEFTPDGRFIFAGDMDGSITVWDSETGRNIRTLAGHHNPVRDIRFTPDGCYALSGSIDGNTRLWELEWDLA